MCCSSCGASSIGNEAMALCTHCGAVDVAGASFSLPAAIAVAASVAVVVAIVWVRKTLRSSPLLPCPSLA